MAPKLRHRAGTLILVPVLIGLAGCAAPRPDRAALAQQVLVGMPKEVLLSCAGVPARSAVIDNRDWFTYHSETVHGYAGGVHGGFGFGYNRGPWDYDPPEIASIGCDATFTLRGGRVERIDFTSPQGTAGNPQCAAIVANCLSLVPAQPVIVTPGPR